MTATDELRRMLDERGVKWEDGGEGLTIIPAQDGVPVAWTVNTWPSGKDMGDCLWVQNRHPLTPAQAIAATLGRESWVNPAWERWHKSLRHDEIKSIGDAVEQLMYEVIEFGGDMGPNGNTCNGIDEGDVLTSGFINEWIARFESTLGRDRYSYEQWREIAMVPVIGGRDDRDR